MTGFKSKRAAAQDKLAVGREQLEQWVEALKDIDALHHPAEPESVDAQKAIADMGQALAQPAQVFGYLSIGENPIFQKEKPEIGRWETLYTAPPQRTWVVLTDKEIEAIWKVALFADYGVGAELSNQPFVHYARAIEAKLRGKNNAV